MSTEIKNYENIEIPYDAYLSRGNTLTPESSVESNGNVEEQPVKDGGAMGDVWITNFIRSNNWSPKKKGFYIDGRTGYAEFSNIVLSGGNISYGKTSFTDTTNAGYHISPAGFYFGSASDASFVKYNIGTASFDIKATLKRTSDGATVIDSSGNLINEILNTSSKRILSDFDFGSTDYAGAVKSGDVTWNTSTGAITGGSGIVVYRKGIVGASAGVTTFSIDATTGNATFSGTITSTAGTIGGWIIGSSTLSSAASGERMVMDKTNSKIELFNSSGNSVLALRYGTTGQYIINCTAQNDNRGIMYVTASTNTVVGLFDVVNNGTGQTMRLYQDNASNTNAVLGLTNNAGNATVLSITQTPSSSLSSIDITHNSDSSPAIDIDNSGSDDSGIEITATPVNTDTHGIKLTISGGASGDALNIVNSATTHLSRAIEITRTINSATDGSAVYIIPANSGSGNCFGITIADGANAKGIDLSALGTKDYFKVAADSGAIGSYAGKIPIRVGSALKYIAYYD